MTTRDVHATRLPDELVSQVIQDAKMADIYQQISVIIPPLHRLPDHKFTPKSLDRFYRYFIATICGSLLVPFKNIHPPSYHGGHISSKERPSYYQKRVYAIRQICLLLDPESKADHVNEMYVRCVTHICSDFIGHSVFGEVDYSVESEEKEIFNEALYLFIHDLVFYKEETINLVKELIDKDFDMNEFISMWENEMTVVVDFFDTLDSHFMY